MKWELMDLFQTMSKRICRYLIKRYFGQYVDDFSQKDLSMKWLESKLIIENVSLNVQALNELCAEYNLPVEFSHGSIDLVSVTVPFHALFHDNTIVELTGMNLVFRPKERPEDVSMFDSMWGSMASSLELAEECLNYRGEDDNDDFEDTDRSEGLVKIAKVIDAVLANMKVRIHDSSFKIEHIPPNSSTGVCLEIKISKAEYFDEAGVNSQSDNGSGADKNSHEPQAYSHKKVVFEGVRLYTSEFSIHSRRESLFAPFTQGCTDSNTFVPGSPEMPPPHCSLPMQRPEEPEVLEDPILISKLRGRQELRLKLKQNEGFIGPKVDVEFNLGAFNLFLIPRQVHILYELLCGILRPSSTNIDSRHRLPSATNKPMRAADFALVEQELFRQQQKLNNPSRSLKNRGWSSHSIDGSDDEFQLMSMDNKQAVELQDCENSSLSTSINSDISRSDSTGNFMSSQTKVRSRNSSTVQAMLQDQLSELTHFRGCCSSICIIILHDDSVQESISVSSKESSQLNSNKSISLKERAETFFNDLATLQISGFDFKDFPSTRDPLSKLCDTNHLRLLASSISIDGNEKSSSIQRILNFTMNFFQFEILECLFNSPKTSNEDCENYPITYVEVFKCDNKVVASENNQDMKEACFKLKYQQIDYTSENRTIKPPVNKLDINFGPVTWEFDISITDRIQTLLSFNSFNHFSHKKESWRESDAFSSSRNSPKTDVTLSSPNLTVNLRFPIPDLRSVHDINRVPWWQQNLHKEILVMILKDFTFYTSLEGDMTEAKYEVQCRDFHGLFKMCESSKAISFLRVCVDPETDEISKERGFDWPRLVIHKAKANTGEKLNSEEVEREEMYSYSISEVIMSNLDSELSPFCATSILYGSKLRKQDEHNEEGLNLSLDHEEVIKPADKETMGKFIDKTIARTELFLEFSLPTVNLVFPSKEFFELIYNRLGNDLLLWQKTSIVSATPYDLNGFRVHVPGLDFSTQTTSDIQYNKNSVYKPVLNDSNSDSDDEEANFCSVHEYWQRQKHKHQKDNSNCAFTTLSLSLAITKGMLSFNAPIIDESNSVISDMCGKLQLFVEDAQIYIASSYRGDPNEGYLCVLADKSTLYHEAADKVSSNVSDVEPLKCSNIKLNKIIYQSEPGIRLKMCDSFCDMLKVAVHIVHNPKQDLKSFKVALDISDATLRHFTHSVSQMWIIQLVDFLKVKDFPVNGYKPPKVVTEFHLNLSNCSIDYRPLRLPIWSCITMDNFNMSCNISASTPSIIFRIISEELRIFLSNTITAKKVDLRKNYVCVVDTGLIDISCRIPMDEKDDNKFELCASNNIIHVRTCSDSFKALLDLVIYLSGNGDIDTVVVNDNKDTEIQKSYITTPEESRNLNILVAEAMLDCPKNRNSNNYDDNNRNPTQPDHYAMDEEFVILDDDPGLGLAPLNGEPEVRLLTNEPINIIENHFSVPPGKTDVLKAPNHYPKPNFLLALRELSLVWHLYGGSDFKSNAKKKNSKKKHNGGKDMGVTFSDEKSVGIAADNSSVSFCKVTPMAKDLDANTVVFSMEYLNLDHKPVSSLETWLQKGGPNRDHNILMELHLNKLKFQREIYPEKGEMASRYVLLMHDIEIRDRLKTSDINKFLYQYSSQKIPRQSNANMIEIKALYTRPDPKRSSEECSLRISCKPLRLNVDQDALFFIIGFFREIFDASSDDSSEGDSDGAEGVSKSNVRVIQQTNISSNSPDSSTDTFYRYFSFCPDVLIRIDYHGKHVQMEEGALRGFLLGLTQLNSSEIKLKRLCYRHGLLGHHKVLAYAINEWQQDIVKHQLQNILSGVGPMNAFVQLFQGIKDLFYLPVSQYQKDGQIVRGIQRGASSFSTSTAMAFLDLASRLLRAIQGAAILSCDMVSPGPSVAYKLQGSPDSYRQNSQPADIREGITNAYNVVKEGLGDTARTFYHAASTEHEHKGVLGAVGATLRQLPPLFIQPIILGSEATHSVLGGIRHQLVPDAHQEDIHKWRTRNS